MCEECVRQLIRTVRSRRPITDRCTPEAERPDGHGPCSAARSSRRALTEPQPDC